MKNILQRIGCISLGALTATSLFLANRKDEKESKLTQFSRPVIVNNYKFTNSNGERIHYFRGQEDDISLNITRTMSNNCTTTTKVTSYQIIDGKLDTVSYMESTAIYSTNKGKTLERYAEPVRSPTKEDLSRAKDYMNKVRKSLGDQLIGD